MSANNSKVTLYLERILDLSEKTQREIALEVGYSRPNIISMMKQGITKIPIEKIPALAKACGVEPQHFLRLAMQEYMPDTWAVISKYGGEMLTDDERAVLQAYRESKEEVPELAVKKPDDFRHMFLGTGVE